MAGYTGTTGVVVPQPAVKPQRYGLFSAVDGPLDMPSHGAISGITYEAEHCGDGFLWPAAECPPPEELKTFGACGAILYGAPFTVGATWQSGAIGHTEAEYKRRTEIRLRDNAQNIVERAFWGGLAAPALLDTITASGIAPVDLTGGTPASVEDGLALLEDFLAQYPYRGILHALPSASPYFTERLLSVPDGKPGAAGTRYVSPMGNTWSFGRGYAGTKPVAGTAPGAGEAYVVATGQVTLWRDPQVYINPILRSMDRTTNQVLGLAEQPWAAAIDCVIGYALVTLQGM